MPLPDAKPDPAGSNVYRQLNSIKLGDLTNEQFDKVYQNVFLNDMSEDELRRLALVGAARQSFSASSSGPIPGTSEVITATVDTSGTPVLLFNPDPGEVWRFNGASINGIGITGSVNHDIWLADQVLSGSFGDNAVLLVDDTATAGNIPLNESQRLNDVIIDENSYMYVESSGTFTTVKFLAHFIRVR